MLGARVRGEAVLGGATLSLDGWDAYVEKNWGGTFPGEWWWGQAALGEGAMAAFAGGRLGGPLAASAVVVRAGERGRALRACPARSCRRRRAAASGACAAGPPAGPCSSRAARRSRRTCCPCPCRPSGAPCMRSEHHLAGRMRVVLRRGRRVVLRAESDVAGLEHGLPEA